MGHKTPAFPLGLPILNLHNRVFVFNATDRFKRAPVTKRLRPGNFIFIFIFIFFFG
jgi:hypothetical protein